MAEEKGFFGRLFEKIGDAFEWLAHIFDAAEKAWDKVDEPLQKALITATSVVNIISTNLNAAPELIMSLINKAFPDLSEEELKKAITEVNKVLNISSGIEDQSLPILITNLQKYLLTVTDSKLIDGVLSSTAQLMTVALSHETPSQAKVAMLVEYVYQKFVKK